MNLPETNLEQSGLQEREISNGGSTVGQSKILIDNQELSGKNEKADPAPPVSSGIPENSRGAQERPASD